MGAAEFTWQYEWPGVADTIAAASEAKARAAIREKHQLKWVPNGARVVRMDVSAYVAPVPATTAAPPAEVVDAVPADAKPVGLKPKAAEPRASTPAPKVSIEEVATKGGGRTLQWATGSATILKNPIAAKRAADLVSKLTAVTGRRSTFGPQPCTPSTRYDDPNTSKRTVATVEAELMRRLHQEDCVKHEGRVIVPGWTITKTNGHAAIARKGESDGEPMYEGETDVAVLTPDLWASYRPVRQLRGVSGAVKWTFDQNLVTVSAEHPEYGSGQAWAHVVPMGATAPVEFFVDDAYLWPLRDLLWTVSVVLESKRSVPLVIFTLNQLRVCVVGMRL